MPGASRDRPAYSPAGAGGAVEARLIRLRHAYELVVGHPAVEDLRQAVLEHRLRTLGPAEALPELGLARPRHDERADRGRDDDELEDAHPSHRAEAAAALAAGAPLEEATLACSEAHEQLRRLHRRVSSIARAKTSHAYP